VPLWSIMESGLLPKFLLSLSNISLGRSAVVSLFFRLNTSLFLSFLQYYFSYFGVPGQALGFLSCFFGLGPFRSPPGPSHFRYPLELINKRWVEFGFFAFQLVLHPFLATSVYPFSSPFDAIFLSRLKIPPCPRRTTPPRPSFWSNRYSVGGLPCRVRLFLTPP